jgi:steroid delta-isomerase-like uncharacterized protein
MASIDKMKEIVSKHLKAFCQGDWKAYKELLTENALYEEEATGRRAQGVDEIVRTVEPWKKAFPDVSVTLKDTIGSGDALVVELEWNGTHKGPLAGPFGSIPPTNKQGKIPAVQVARFEGDRIREIRHYFDLLSVLRQLGVAPQVGAPPSSPR